MSISIPSPLKITAQQNHRGDRIALSNVKSVISQSFSNLLNRKKRLMIGSIIQSPCAVAKQVAQGISTREAICVAIQNCRQSICIAHKMLRQFRQNQAILPQH